MKGILFRIIGAFFLILLVLVLGALDPSSGFLIGKTLGIIGLGSIFARILGFRKKSNG